MKGTAGSPDTAAGSQEVKRNQNSYEPGCEARRALQGNSLLIGNKTQADLATCNLICMRGMRRGR